MTIAGSNGSNRSQSPLIPDLAEAINVRPDRVILMMAENHKYIHHLRKSWMR